MTNHAPPRICSILLWATMTALSPLSAQGVISINLKAGNTINNQNTFAGFTAWQEGAWINTSAAGISNLTDATGVATTADISAPGNRAGSFSGAPLNFSPMKSGIQFFAENPAPTVISEIPYSSYKVVVYLTGFDGNNASYITDGTSTYYWDPKAFSKDLTLTTQATYETGTTAAKANIAIFGSDEAPLTSSSITLNFGLAPGASGGGGIGGFQIIEIPTSDEPLELTLVRNGDNYDLSWNSRTGMVYDLLSSADLSNSPTSNWNPHLEPLTVYRGIPASGTGTNVLTNVPSDGPRRFFVVRESEAPQPLPLEDFDAMPPSLPAGWTVRDSGSGTMWQVGTPTGENSPPTAASGQNSAGTNIAGNYLDGTDTALTSPEIIIPPERDALLSFRQFIDTDLALIDPDLGFVRILDADNDTPIASLEISSIEGSAAGWSDQSLALPAGEVAGKTIKLEFRFVSNEDGSVWGGFYIDDVSVTLP
ncbi:MAG: hypothetical protein CBB78_007390 [Roseibacillus sp. TMED18]|nr:MAG: hypothetical protein CBB78_007390 [Roseibacillus sp. TMED18]